MSPPCQFYNTGFIYSKPKLYNYHAEVIYWPQYSTRGRVTRPQYSTRLQLGLVYRVLVFPSMTNLESVPRFAEVCFFYNFLLSSCLFLVTFLSLYFKEYQVLPQFHVLISLVASISANSFFGFEKEGNEKQNPFHAQTNNKERKKEGESEKGYFLPKENKVLPSFQKYFCRPEV